MALSFDLPPSRRQPAPQPDLDVSILLQRRDWLIVIDALRLLRNETKSEVFNADIDRIKQILARTIHEARP
jgi:hypothetical protein